MKERRGTQPGRHRNLKSATGEHVSAAICCYFQRRSVQIMLVGLTSKVIDVVLHDRSHGWGWKQRRQHSLIRLHKECKAARRYKSPDIALEMEWRQAGIVMHTPRPNLFRNLGAVKSVARRSWIAQILLISWSWGFKVVKRPVGMRGRGRKSSGI